MINLSYVRVRLINDLATDKLLRECIWDRIKVLMVARTGNIINTIEDAIM